ncbi:MAG: tRNA(Met) cytidine acetate ligase [Mobilitalea sp.]
MKVVGLITEYNPFHNGHKYHIEEAKRVTGADYVIAVMSGNFVQRGTPAVIDKYSRTEMALRNGVDLVLELPVCYATASAEFFALGAVSLLDKLGIVDALCFGSECGDITLIREAAQFILHAPASFDTCLQSFLKEGLPYPAARLKALEQSLEAVDNENRHSLSKVLMEPNNILGIEYVKAIYRLNSSMTPVTIHRISAQYHDNNLSEINKSNPDSSKVSNDDEADTSELVISSATAIRGALHQLNSNTNVGLSGVEYSVPDDVFRFLIENHLKTYPICEEDFSQIIKYKLLAEDSQSLTNYMDISGDLADRLKNIHDFNLSITNLTQKIKTKNMTLTRINRALIHLLLNIQTEPFVQYNQTGYSAYARVLGIKKEATHLLRKIGIVGKIPIIIKVSNASKQLDYLGMRMLSEDLFATHIYNQAVYIKYNNSLVDEYKHGIIIL